MRAARFPRRYDHCTLESFEVHDPSHEAALAVARDWVARWPDRVEHGMLFVGRPGTGKTHLAVGIAREMALSRGAHVLFYEQRDLLRDLQETFDGVGPQRESEVLQSVQEAELLVLDDLGAGRTTPWARDVLHDVLVHRYNEKLPMVMTSNRPLGEDAPASAPAVGPAEGLTLVDRLGEPLMSRIYEMCLTVEFHGKDFRKEVLAAKYRL